MGQTFVYIAWWGLTRMPVLLEKPFRKKNYQRGRRNKLLQKICNAETALKFLEYSFPRKAFNLYLLISFILEVSITDNRTLICS